MSPISHNGFTRHDKTKLNWKKRRQISHKPEIFTGPRSSIQLIFAVHANLSGQLAMCQTGNTLLPRWQQRHGHPHRPFTVSRDNSFERQLAGRRVRVYRRETWTFRARKVCVTRVCRRGWTRARLDSHARPTRPVGAAEPGKATQRNCCLACWGFRVTGNTDLDYAKVLDIQTRTHY
jgi:hypothetical protein